VREELRRAAETLTVAKQLQGAAAEVFAATLKKHLAPSRQVVVLRPFCARLQVALPLLLLQAPGTAMLRITVALIVVTLTGLPVVPAICLSWCGDHKTTTEYCHDEAVGNGSPTITAARADCSAPVIENPYIREDARPVLHTVQLLTPARTASMLTIAVAHRFNAPRQHTVLASPHPPLVLRV
jgi:hypothetical protein